MSSATATVRAMPLRERRILWLESEIEELRRLWLTMSVDKIACQLKRTPDAVRSRAKLLGLPKRGRTLRFTAVIAGPLPECRHCGYQPRKLRPKGLCNSCSEKPEIRALYPSTSKFAHKGIPDYVPTAEELDALEGNKQRLAMQSVRDRLATLLGYFGERLTFEQAANHLREDRLTVTREEFAEVKDEICPAPEDWKAVANG